MNVYSIDIHVVATLYVKAKSEDEALLKAIPMSQGMFELAGEPISQRQFDDPALPEVSLSPAMTGQGFDNQTNPTINLIEEDVPVI